MDEYKPISEASHEVEGLDESLEKFEEFRDKTLEDCKNKFPVPALPFAGYPFLHRWNQSKINDWQDKIFGLEDVSPHQIFKKLDEEHEELRRSLRKLAQDGLRSAAVNLEQVIREMADNVVVLYHMAGVLGRVDLHKYIDEKMDVNEKRKWNVQDGTGHHE